MPARFAGFGGNVSPLHCGAESTLRRRPRPLLRDVLCRGPLSGGSVVEEASTRCLWMPSRLTELVPEVALMSRLLHRRRHPAARVRRFR